jgi:hypothetical protein
MYSIERVLNGRTLACDEVLSSKLEVVFEMRRHRRDGGDGCMMEAGGALIGCCFEGASFLSLASPHSAIQPFSQAGWPKENHVIIKPRKQGSVKVRGVEFVP